VWEEQPVPRQLPSNQATVIALDGNLYFASVYSFDDLWPTTEGTTNAVLILHLRDRTIYSLTGVNWAIKSAREMQARGIRVMVSGVDQETMALMERVGLVELLGRDSIFLSTPRLASRRPGRSPPPRRGLPGPAAARPWKSAKSRKNQAQNLGNIRPGRGGTCVPGHSTLPIHRRISDVFRTFEGRSRAILAQEQTLSDVMPIPAEREEVLSKAYQKARPEGLCPCGSGLTYGQCHGWRRSGRERRGPGKPVARPCSAHL
jgi:hypothetical protein